MVKGIIITHGGLGEELLKTARMVFGDFDGCSSISNSGKATQVLVEELEKAVSSGVGESCMLFVDFFGGSCCYVCLKFQMEHSDVPIISGVNLPILLAFLNKRNDVPFDELARELIRRGQDSIKMVDIE